jgi:hypothetical protein
MTKYNPLSDWLERQLTDRVEVTVDDIEDDDKIGVQLPQSAREYREWWANETSPKTRHLQRRAWTEMGWKVESVDLAKETVVFARTAK